MSKYTYHIVLNGSDYTEVFPVNEVELTGYWEDEWIDNMEINELEINYSDNQYIYDILEADRKNPDKYSNEYFFNIKKYGVLWKEFIFGIKWGSFDYETKIYKFTPLYYGNYYKHYSQYLDTLCDITTIGDSSNLYYFEEDEPGSPGTTHWPYQGVFNRTHGINIYSIYRIYEMLQEAFTNYDPDITFQSTILNNDSSTVLSNTIEYGIIKDYVTGNENPFINGHIALMIKPDKDGLYSLKTPRLTLNDLNNILDLFQIYPFFDDDASIRFEHILFILTNLQDNAISMTPENDEKEFEFLNEQSPYLETFDLRENDGNTDEDFVLQEIIYEPQRSGIFSELITNGYSYFSNVDNYITNGSDYQDGFILAGTNQEVKKLFATSPITTDGNTFSGSISSGTTYYIYSNDLKIWNGVSDSIYFIINLTTIGTTPTVKKCYLRDRSSSLTISNEVTLNANGDTTVTLNPTDSADDGEVVIELSLVTGSSTISGYIYNDYANERYIDAYKAFRLLWQIGGKTGIKRLNGPFSQSNIINNYWNIYRPTNSAEINGVSKVFTNSKFVEKRTIKNRYYPDDINLLYGINDGERIAKINRYVRKLDSDFVTFDLIYQEYN